MTLKQLTALSLLFLLLTLCPPQAEASSLRAYSREGGSAYTFFGTYPKNADGTGESLLWRVLKVEEGQALLLSEDILDVQPAHTGPGYQGFQGSTLEKWLREEFAMKAFSQEERAAIIQAQGQPDISLPSVALLRDESLGFLSGKDRIAEGTDWALSKGLLTYGKTEGAYWTTDKAQSMQSAQRRVLDKGNLGYAGADVKNIGVRPVIRLDLSRIKEILNVGNREDPYRLIPDGSLLPTPSPLPLPTPTPSPQPMGEITTDGFPPLGSEGFLPAGVPEYIFIDAQNGVWRYASHDLRIVITRYEDPTVPLRWLGAEIFMRDGTQPLQMFSHDKEHMLEDRDRFLEKPAIIMRNNNLVFSMDGDYFIYRLGRAKADKKNNALGVVIRGGEIILDKPASPKRNTYPPLDMLALFSDGNMQVYKAGEKTAAELVSLGAQDVLSFGPYLIRDGEINTSYTTYGTSLQPRAAIGMISRGHYWAVIVEGRIRPSRGMTCLQVADLMLELGCQTAFNLDGGWTSAMVFMGKQLNQLDKSGVRDNARTQNEVMGIGHTNAYKEGWVP